MGFDSFDDDAEKTVPGTRAARHRHITSQTALDAAELLLGRLDSVDDDGRHQIVRTALQQAFDRGQAAARLEQADLEIELARVKATRDQAQRTLRDADAALRQHEREDDPESYAKLRTLLQNGLKG